MVIKVLFGTISVMITCFGIAGFLVCISMKEINLDVLIFMLVINTCLFIGWLGIYGVYKLYKDESE